MQGGAADGGLFVPVDGLPQFSVGELSRLTDLSHSERALRILEKLIHPCDIPPSVLSALVESVYSDGEKLLLFLAYLIYCQRQ